MQWKTLRSSVVLGPTDFQCISKYSCNILKNILFCFLQHKKKKLVRFGTTWVWIKDNRRAGKFLTCCTGQCQAAIYAGWEGELSWSLHTPLDPTSTGNHSIPAKDTSFRKTFKDIYLFKFQPKHKSSTSLTWESQQFVVMICSLSFWYKHEHVINIELIKCAMCGSSSCFNYPPHWWAGQGTLGLQWWPAGSCWLPDGSACCIVQGRVNSLLNVPPPLHTIQLKNRHLTC